jgi:hypothetical protein
VPSDVVGLEPIEHQQLLLSVGTHRTNRPLSPIEVARLFEKCLSQGASTGQCASAAHFKSASMVTRFTSLLSLDPKIQHLVDWGQSGATLAFSAAFELSRLGTEDHLPVAEAVLEHRLGSSEVRQLVQLRKRSGKPIGACIDEALAMRPRIQRRYIFIGSVREALRARLGAMSQAERDTLLRSALGAVSGLSDDTSVRLGTERFTLVGSERMMAGLGAADPERVINDSLQRLCKP